MAEKSYNKIEDFSSEKDPSNGLPWSGKSVREFINESASIARQNRSNKIGASYFDPTSNTMYYFASKDALAEWISTGDNTLIVDSVVMNFTGTMYQVKVLSEMPSKTLYFTTQMDKAEITVSFLSQKKGITDSSWQDIIEDYRVSVYVDKGGTGAYSPLLLDQFVISGSTFTFDVRKALATGTNRIRIVAVGTESGDKTQGSEVFVVNLTSMYLAPSNFTWYRPFMEGETYSLGGMNIGGNLQKILKIKVSKEGYEKLYEVNIGSDIYTTTAYVFKGLQFPEAGTGVYNVDIWLDANGLESDHLVYNIICVSQADKFTAQIVAIGNPAKAVYNFSDNVLFDYCVYNCGNATGTPHIKVMSIVNTNPTTLVDEDLVDVATSTPLSYTASVEIELEDDSASLQIESQLTYANEQVAIFPVDNSKSYPATTGAVFYLNPSSRSNAQDNREKIVNAINSAEISATFRNMSWADGADGWTTDDNGRKCLRLPAMTGVEVAYKPLSNVTQKTIEFVYKVNNAADYQEPIISICSDLADPQFRGIKITPKNILIHSRDLNVEDSLQDYNTTDEETLHVLVTIIPNYKTNYGNLAQIYCNGTKVRSFSFETADRWDVSSNIKFGSETADLYLYKMRVYDRGFESYDALKNYINSLPSTSEKESMSNKIEKPLNDSYKLSYDDCVRNNLNTMVIEILDQDQSIPSISKPSAKQCNLWIKIHNPESGELDEDFTYLFGGNDILNQTIEGQGTTAMTYARWNFRWKLDSTYNKRRITAKKNFASSMHSHKMGATRLFNDLNRKIVGANEANGRVAVFQYPVYGFQKIPIEGTPGQYMYEPIGLYTIGPDKGDKTTFGFDNKTYKNTLVHMEGADHTPKGVGMDYPWNALRYSGAAEAIGAPNASGNVVAAYEVGAAGPYDPADEPTDVKAFLDVEFKPAYNVIYNNSTYIEGVTETLEQMNANVNAWQTRTNAEGVSYASLEFYTDGVYDLYFFNTETQKYEPNGVNLLADINMSQSTAASMTLAQKTETFKNVRRARFKGSWGNFWHTQDSIFHYTFMLLFGATDNFKKNTYPYKFKAVADRGLYRWRSDDLDTLFDINNQGLAAKAYSILVGDKTSTGSGSIYRGDTSVFWTLIKETQEAEIKAMVHSIFNTMVELCPSSYGGNTLDKLVGCIRYYFWDKAQAYFPASAYNMDAEWTYEDTWAAGLYKEVNPLSQSLGGHYEAERDWVTMRILFTAMYYNYGPFGAVNDSFSDTSTGQIAYGGAGAHTFSIVMACDGNPTILRGQSELVTKGERVYAGETVQLTVPDSSGADTRIYVQGVDWMEGVGDLCTLQVSADNPLLSLSSKRMQTFKIGDQDASRVTTNVSSLSFGSCPSMMSVDARNAKSLGGNIDLTKMPRLQEAYFGGTGVKSVNIATGSKIMKLGLGKDITQLSLVSLKFLNNDNFSYDDIKKLEFLRIENCDGLSAFELMRDVYNQDGSALRDVRVIGFDEIGTIDDVTMVGNMAVDKDKNGNDHIYNGIDNAGAPMNNSKPVIEGKLKVDGNIFDDDYENIVESYPNLDLSYNDLYARIADQEVFRILMAQGLGDGTAVLLSKVENLTSLGGWFENNEVIETFNELAKFINVKRLYMQFYRCTNLKSIDIRNIESIETQSFNGCVSLSGELISPNLTFVGGSCFRDCKISGIDLGNVKTIEGYAFYGCSLLQAVNLSSVEKLGVYAFAECSQLTCEISLPKLQTLNGNCFRGSNITSISAPLATFVPTTFCYRCNSLQNVDIPNAEYLETDAFRECPNLLNVYFPHLTKIAANAFYKSGVISVETPMLKEVGYSAFDGCASLESIDLIEVEKLDNNAFRGCDSLSGHIIAPKLTTTGQNSFSKTGITSITAEKLETVTYYLFGECPNLEKAILPMVKRIEQFSFRYCRKLKEVNFDSVEEIVSGCFQECIELKEVRLPSIIKLGAQVFDDSTNTFELLDFGNSLQEMGNYSCSAGTKMKAIIIRATTPPTLGSGVFDNTKNCPIYVPDASVDAYKSATNWTTYASRIKPLSEYVEPTNEE